MRSFPATYDLDSFITVPYVSTIGPDSGRAYILFIWNYREFPNEKIFKFDIETKEFTEIEFPQPDATPGTLNRSRNVSGAFFDSIRNATYFCKDSKVFEISQAPLNYDNSEVMAEIEFSPFDGGDRSVEKEFKGVALNPAEADGVSLYYGVNGLPPVIPLQLDYTKQSHIDLNNVSGYMLHIKATKQGAAKTFLSGLSVYTEKKLPTRSRGWTPSRREAVDDLWEKRKLVVGGTQAAASGTVTVNHGLPKRPVAAFASLFRAGTVSTPDNLFVTWNATQITATYDGYASGDIIHWLAVLEPSNLYETGVQAGELVFWRSEFQFFDVMEHPQCFLLNRMANTDTNTMYIAEADDTRLYIRLRNPGDFTTITEKQAAWGAFYSANTATSQWACGNEALTADTDTVVTHNLGVNPSVVLVHSREYPNKMSIVRAKSSANITLRIIGGSHRVDWIALP